MLWPSYVCFYCCLIARFGRHAATVNGNTTVSVTCTPTSGSAWPSGGFNVNVTASGTGLTGCSSSASASTAITLSGQPYVYVDGPSSSSVCSNTASRLLVYSLYSDAPVSYTVLVNADPGVSCTSGPPTTGEAVTYRLQACLMVHMQHITRLVPRCSRGGKRTQTWSQLCCAA